MLTDLSIRNLAIIDALHISLQPGLTILTGETGAGKSIIIDAVGLIMGGRASADLIRSGEEEAQVEAIFDLNGGATDVAERLSAAGIDCDGELLIRRTVSTSGKNRIFINNSLATAGLLADIVPRLINIYGQHESQTLLKPDNHLRLLDSYAGLTQERISFDRTLEQLRQAREQLAQLEQAEREAGQRLDLLNYQVNEISAADLKDGEETTLEERRSLLAGAEKLAMATGSAYEQLYGAEDALLGRLRSITHLLGDAAAIDRSLSGLAELFNESYLQLEDASLQLRDYASHVEADPHELQSIDDRIDLINRLKRKYGGSIEEILAHLAAASGEIEQLQNGAQSRHELETHCQRLNETLLQTGSELSRKRSEAAPRLARALEAEIRQLAMPGAVIAPVLEPVGEPRCGGMERLELMFSPNPGEPPRQLARIASGGELSRLMLAFKQVLPESDVATLIFDEVDTGIGGATSETVGRKLRSVAAHQQVLCITHLPQVAACADHHLKVEKLQRNDRTVTSVTTLSREARTSEIARMIAGERVTDSALQHADELIQTFSTAG